MLKPEASYAFKQELNQIHKKDRRNYALTPAPQQCLVTERSVL